MNDYQSYLVDVVVMVNVVEDNLSTMPEVVKYFLVLVNEVEFS
jgi:hypothetical protein